MPQKTYSPLFRKLNSIGQLDEAEREAVLGMPFHPRAFPRNTDIVLEGDQPSQTCVLIEGYACRNKIVGSKRQVLSFQFAGDLPDLQSYLLGVSDHNLSTLTSCSVAFIAHSDLRLLLHAHPRLNDIFWKDTLIEASILRMWIANVGQRQGPVRLAHLICEVATRLKSIGLGDDGGFKMFMTQATLAEATGMTSIHVNRVLHLLRDQGLIEISDREMRIVSWERLTAFAGFDPTYLHLHESVH